MKRRMLHVNWQGIAGACKKRKILKLRCNVNGLYECPVESCLHKDFKSQRGLRKHINTIHTWYYYFDSIPEVARKRLSSNDLLEESAEKRITPFSLTSGVGLEFLNWLQNPAGGAKKERDAKLVAQRAMRFLRSCMDDQCEELLNVTYVDCCVGSPDTILSFFKVMEEDWKCTHTNAVCYITSIIFLMDYRKTYGVSDVTLRSFVAAEVYLRRARTNFSRKKRIEYKKNLAVERLIAKNSWATLGEIESVITFHSNKFSSICNACRDSEYSPMKGDLVFATRFIIAFLFIWVKCTRPMSYQFLTLQLFEESKRNGGFVDQTTFKTQETHHFDTLVISEPVRDILQTYIDVIRPRLTPQCDYVLVNGNGNQYCNLHYAMNLLTFEAIGKFITPTIFRMVIETESMEKLDAKEQAVISKDQKHNSNVAKIAYQKKMSREVAVEGRACLKKLTGENATKHTEQLADQLIQSASTTPNTHNNIIDISNDDDTKDQEEFNFESSSTAGISVDAEENAQTNSATPIGAAGETSALLPNEIKKEEDEGDGRSKDKKHVVFTESEDEDLKAGIAKYGKGNWARILKDSTFKFQKCRTRDTLQMRAITLEIVKKKGKK